MNMTPEHRLDLPVQLLVNGCLHPGFLEHRRRRGGRWEGFVRWTEAPGRPGSAGTTAPCCAPPLLMAASSASRSGRVSGLQVAPTR